MCHIFHGNAWVYGVIQQVFKVDVRVEHDRVKHKPPNRCSLPHWSMTVNSMLWEAPNHRCHWSCQQGVNGSDNVGTSVTFHHPK